MSDQTKVEIAEVKAEKAAKKKADAKDTRTDIEKKVDWLMKVVNVMVRKFEKQFGVDIDGDGHVGVPSDDIGAPSSGFMRIGMIFLLMACIAIPVALFAAEGDLWSTGPNDEYRVLPDGGVLSAGSGTFAGAISGVHTGIGTASVATVTAAQAPYGNVNKTVLTLADTVILLNTTAATNTWGSVKLYDFPEGRILVHGVTVAGIDIAVQTNTIPLSAGGDFALGTVAASSNVLASTAVDLCPSTSIDAITNVVNSALAASAQFDGTATAKDMFLNFGIDHQDVLALTPATNTVSGVITIHWTNLGDY